jgi:hypothetical protein
MAESKEYSSKNIKVQEGLDSIRKNFDVIEISNKIKRQGDILVLSKELKVNYHSLKRAAEEGRILKMFPNINKSKTTPLARLRTTRDLELFSKVNDINKLASRALYRAVKEWNLDVQKKPSLMLTQEEQNIIIGTLLGDASIKKRDKNSCLRMAHSNKQEPYIKWKIAKLSFLGISEHINKKRMINNREVDMIYFSTRTHPVFNYYKNLFYGLGEKTITKDILNKLNPQSLAVWICDDGSYNTTQDYIILCTNSYSLEEHELLKKFFNEKFGLNPTIGFRDGKYYYLRFKKEDTKKLVGLIKDYLPESMLYKIGEKNNV